jgi:SAM-dependent methyltransferase
MYQQIARYYDLLHNELTRDIQFVAKLAEQTGDPILEIGCGTGRLLLPLARKGYRATGVDASEDMLTIARAKLNAENKAVQERVLLHHSDFNEAQLPGEFGLAVIAYNTLMHFGPASLAFCLNNIRRHVRQGGMLFVDVDNPTEVHDSSQDGLLFLDRAVHDVERDEMVTLSVSSTGDGESQTRDTVWLVDVSPVSGGPLNRIIATATLHYYFVHQLQQIFEAAGFRVLSQYGDYDLSPYLAEQSPRLLLLAIAR